MHCVSGGGSRPLLWMNEGREGDVGVAGIARG